MKYLTLILAILMSISAAAQTANSSTEDNRHASNVDAFEHLRVFPPAVITDYDGRTVTYSIDVYTQTTPGQYHSTGIKVGQLNVDASTQLPKNFSSRPKGKWWIAYCEEHSVVRFIQEYVPGKK